MTSNESHDRNGVITVDPKTLDEEAMRNLLRFIEVLLEIDRSQKAAKTKEAGPNKSMPPSLSGHLDES